MTDVELLPLPDWMECLGEISAANIRDYARACVEANLAPLQAENERLREALQVMVEMVEMNGFGRDYAMDVARAALAANVTSKEN